MYKKGDKSLIYILYLSESSPDIKDPTNTPTKNKEVVKGDFQSLSHTRFHWKRKEKKSQHF